MKVTDIERSVLNKNPRRLDHAMRRVGDESGRKGGHGRGREQKSCQEEPKKSCQDAIEEDFRAKRLKTEWVPDRTKYILLMTHYYEMGTGCAQKRRSQWFYYVPHIS